MASCNFVSKNGVNFLSLCKKAHLSERPAKLGRISIVKNALKRRVSPLLAVLQLSQSGPIDFKINLARENLLLGQTLGPEMKLSRFNIDDLAPKAQIH